MTEARDLQHELFDMLMESQYWSPSQMQAYQRGQIEQLLRHAKTQVPFYENRLDAVFARDGSIDWDKWTELPIVKRSDLIDHRDAMQAKLLPRGHGPVGTIQSSGSTGHPVTTTLTKLTKISSDAARWRANVWAGLDFSQVMCLRNGVETDVVPPYGVEEGFWGPSWDPAARRGRIFRMTRKWSSADQLDFVIRTGAPYVAIGSTKVGRILGLEALQRGLRPAVSHILVNGEPVDSEDRDVCRRAFGAEIVDLYSSKEGAHMAHPCPVGHGYHVCAERVLIEIVDAVGRPVPPGVSGRVVITPFYNTAQPLIRYDQGDMATFGPPCDCGRNLPVLHSLDGRVVHMFRHPDGRRRTRGFPEKYHQTLDARMWQFAQVGPLDFEIRYVPVDPDRRGDEAEVATAFREWFFDDARIVFKRLDAIPLTASGKYMEYVYEADETLAR